MEKSLAFKFMTFSMIHARDDAEEKKIIEGYPRWEQYDPTKVYVKGVHDADYGDGFQKYEHQHRSKELQEYQ